MVKPGGVVVTVGGVPDAKFGKAWGLNPVLVLGLRFMMRKVTRLARKVDAHFEYHFVEARGEQLGAIAALLEQGEIKPVLDRTFPFAETRAAIAHVESGRAVGKVVLVADSAR